MGSKHNNVRVKVLNGITPDSVSLANKRTQTLFCTQVWITLIYSTRYNGSTNSQYPRISKLISKSLKVKHTSIELPKMLTVYAVHEIGVFRSKKRRSIFITRPQTRI